MQKTLISSKHKVPLPHFSVMRPDASISGSDFQTSPTMLPLTQGAESGCDGWTEIGLKQPISIGCHMVN